MNEQRWSVTPSKAAPTPDLEPGIHSVVIDGLKVEVKIEASYVHWSVEGFLADVPVRGGAFVWKLTPEELEAAKARAIAAAHRLHAAGVRGAVGYPVGCCERLFTTKDAADQHEVEHLIAREGEQDAIALGVPPSGRRYTVGYDLKTGSHSVLRDGVLAVSGFRSQYLASIEADRLEALAAEDRQRESEASERTPDEVGDLHDAGEGSL